MGKRYFGNFSGHDSMVSEFLRGEYDYEKREHKLTVLPDGFPTDEQVLFAAYGTEQSYQGDATVVYETPDGLFIVTAGHCSCYGLEGTWGPVATTRKALGEMWKDDRYYSDYDKETVDAFNVLFPSVTK